MSKHIQVVNGDALSILQDIAIDGPVLMLTDPPYDERTHKNAVSDGDGQKIITFQAADLDYIRQVFATAAHRFDLRWVIATMAYQHAFELEQRPPDGLEMVRIGVWVKGNPVPQFTGDRPAQGWEAIVYMHRPGKKHWHGGGKAANFMLNAVQSARWPTEKPELLYSNILSLFADPGDTILDPFCGSGTSLRVAKNQGLRVIGIEIDPKACKIIERRMAQEVLLTT